MNTEIEAALFDIGNVILPFDYSRAIRRLATKNQSGREPDLDAVLASRMALEAGKTSREEFLRVARREFGHTGTDAEFLEVWEDIFESSPEMICRKSMRACWSPLLSYSGCLLTPGRATLPRSKASLNGTVRSSTSGSGVSASTIL